MRNSSWNDLLSMVKGVRLNYRPVGFIIDSPWIPGWYGISYADYYFSDNNWLKSNLEAANRFPDVWFMPGFWSEFGMCTEPSAFGSRMVFPDNMFPHAEKVLHDIADIESLPQPDVKSDGLLPFVIKRLMQTESSIREADHQIRFAVSRGPFNIASYLMGTTEFMTTLAINPEASHRLLERITIFICDWLSWQKECFPSAGGILILDDIIGFVGEAEFREFVVPYFKRIFLSTGADIRFLHNDADGLVTSNHLCEMGVNLFNFSFNHSFSVIRELAGDDIILVGNIPPRDILANGTPDDVKAAVRKSAGEIKNYDRIVWSAGGGMPPGVGDDNINAFIDAVRELGKKSTISNQINNNKPI